MIILEFRQVVIMIVFVGGFTCEISFLAAKIYATIFFAVMSLVQSIFEVYSMFGGEESYSPQSYDKMRFILVATCAVTSINV